jgi:hypothetical protein
MDTKTKSKYARGSKKYENVATGDLDRQIADSAKDIPGWGIDADPENDPTYPMKHLTGADHERIHYQRPPQQESNVEVFHSIERPGLTAVYGTSSPPSGLSGSIRRFAYKFSEADARHWLSLLFADRVNAVEGIIDDLRKGTVPNIFAERGWTAEWKYNRPQAIRTIAFRATAFTVGIAAYFLYRNRIKNRSLSTE